MIIDGWNYDMSAAPRDDAETIIAIARPDEHWTKYGLQSEAAAVYWDSGVYGDEPINHENVGWMTGGCNRYPDEAFVCWRPFPAWREQRDQINRIFGDD